MLAEVDDLGALPKAEQGEPEPGASMTPTRVTPLMQRVGAVGVGAGMRISNSVGLDVEALLDHLYTGGINASISWLCDGRIEVKLGDARSGYDAETKVDSFAEAAEWLRDKALIHYPHSKFAHSHAALLGPPNNNHRADGNTGMHWSEIDLLDLGHLLTRRAPIKEIASFLRRTPAEVRDKIAALGRSCKR
jgi:hypothetical protein